MAETKLKELIFDNDQLVTYTRLSKQLNVHVNESKRLLWEFWSNNKAEATICATFAIMGLLPDNSDRIELVEESALSSTKEKFQKIYSEHIYSLQKSLPDLQTLALIELPYTPFTSINCKESSLKFTQDSSNSSPVTKEEMKEKEPQKMETIKAISDSKKSEKKDTSLTEKKDTSFSEKKDSSLTEEKKDKKTVVKEKSKKVSEKTKKPIQSREAGFKNMFAKVADMNSKRLAAQKEEEEKNKIVVFEEDDSESDEEIERSIEMEDSPKKSDKKEKVSETKDSEKRKDSEKAKASQNAKDSQKAKNNQKSKKNVKRKVESNKGSNNVKKRKRIIAESDSSEEERNLSDFEEEVKENTMLFDDDDEEECKKPKSPEATEKNGKHVVHKVEDVRFVDEDGFLVTKKVNVSTEITTDTKKERSPSPKRIKEVNINKKQTKQSTLMSFFKKK